MKKIIIVCTAIIFGTTVSAQNAGSAGTNTGASVYKSPEILTDKVVAEARKPVVDPAQKTAVTQQTHRTIHDQQPTVPVTTVKPAQAAVEPTAPSRLQAINVTSKDQPVVTGQQPATAETKVKPAPAENFDKTIPGTLFAPPALNVGTAADANTNAVPVQTKMPELKISQDAQKAETEIPASVNPAPVKKPVATQQGKSN